MKLNFLMAMVGVLIGTNVMAASNFEKQVRCSGLTKKGIQIGVDIKLDAVDRVIGMSTFEQESIDVENVDELGSPSIYLKLDNQGKIAVFGFKTFNDGLESINNISYVAGSPKLSTLELSEAKVTSKIVCKILK